MDARCGGHGISGGARTHHGCGFNRQALPPGRGRIRIVNNLKGVLGCDFELTRRRMRGTCGVAQVPPRQGRRSISSAIRARLG